MVDPFDIEWVESDPLDRNVVMLKSLIAARESAGKHTGQEYLSPEEVRDLIRDPDRIDESAQRISSDVYYQRDSSYTNPYARAVVRFNDEENGIVVSWSRYKKPVSSYGVKYKKPGSQW